MKQHYLLFSMLLIFNQLFTAPVNDACSSATTLTPSATCSFTAGTTEAATDDNLAGECTVGTENSVWYKFVATRSASTITVDGVAGFYAAAGVLTNSCSSTTRPSGGDCVYTTTSGDIITLPLTGLTIGETYYIQVYDVYGGVSATHDFDICVTAFDYTTEVTNILWDGGAYRFLVGKDSNCPDGGPEAGYYSVEICNTNSINIDFGTITWSVAAAGAPYFTLGTSETATRYVGVLQPGECRNLSWWINFPCISSNASGVCTAIYDFFMTSSTLGVVETSGIRLCTSNAASGSGFVSAPTGLTFSGGIGGYLCYDITHGASAMKAGEFLSWSGAGIDEFAGGCYQQVSACVVSKSSNACPDFPLTCDTQVYQAAADCGGNPVWQWTVNYCYRVLCTGSATVAGYTEAFQGGNFQYSMGSNYTLPGAVAANNVQIAKSASPNTNLILNDIVTYTITLTNPGGAPMTVDRVTDNLPTELQFQSISVSSGVPASELSVVPSMGSTGTLTFVGGGVSSVAPYANIYIPAGGSVTIVYTAKVVDASQVEQVTNTANATTGSYTTPNASATVAINSPLPVDLLSFSGKANGRQNDLLWATASESNSSHFEVERSANGLRFETLGKIDAKGNSSETSLYMFHDMNPIAKAFYRLKQVDRDGNSLTQV